MRARIYPLALGKIIKHALTDLENEVAGLLIGKYLIFFNVSKLGRIPIFG